MKISAVALCASLLATSVFGVAMPESASGVDAGCSDYYLLAARGSGQDDGGYVDDSTGKAGMGSEMYSVMSGLRDKIESEGDSATLVGAQYRAVSVWGGASSITGLRKALKLGGAYDDSVAEGIVWIKNEVAGLSVRCPDARMIVGGYSQGAHTMGTAIQTLTPQLQSKISAAIFLADPRFNPHDSDSAYGDYLAAHGGAFGPRPAWEVSFPVFSYCHYADAICNLTSVSSIYATWGVRDYVFLQQATSSLGGGLFGQHTNYIGAREIPNSIARVSSVLYHSDVIIPLSAGLSSPRDAVATQDAWFSAADSQSDPTDPIVSYSWSWGDGTSDQSTKSSISHRFNDPGEYEVSVTVTTRTGRAATASRPVVVGARPIEVPGSPRISRHASDAEITLSWEAVQDASSYRVTTDSGDLLEAFSTPEEQIDWTIDDLENGVEYTYCVAAVNELGQSDPTCVSITPFVPYDPSANVDATYRLNGPGFAGSISEGVQAVVGTYDTGYLVTDAGDLWAYDSNGGVAEASIPEKVTEVRCTVDCSEVIALTEVGDLYLLGGGDAGASLVIEGVAGFYGRGERVDYMRLRSGSTVQLHSALDRSTVSGAVIDQFDPWSASGPDYRGGIALTASGQLIWVNDDKAEMITSGTVRFTDVVAGRWGTGWALDRSGHVWGIAGTPQHSADEVTLTQVEITTPIASMEAGDYADVVSLMSSGGEVFLAQCGSSTECGSSATEASGFAAGTVYSRSNNQFYILDKSHNLHFVAAQSVWGSSAPVYTDTVVAQNVLHFELEYGPSYALTLGGDVLWGFSGSPSLWMPFDTQGRNVNRLECGRLGACFAGVTQ